MTWDHPTMSAAEYADEWNRTRPSGPTAKVHNGIVRLVLFEGNLSPGVVTAVVESVGGRHIARHVHGAENNE